MQVSLSRPLSRSPFFWAFDAKAADFLTGVVGNIGGQAARMGEPLHHIGGSLETLEQDANILFSAAKSDGAIRRLLKELRGAGHPCVADSYVIGER